MLQQGNFPDLTSRQKVNLLELEMAKQPQVTLECKHHFSYGIYARELLIPAGIMLTGKIHKYPQLNILVKGRMRVLVGDEVKEIYAPFTVASEAGTKRIAIALEDCIWITIHGTHLTDLGAIEERFIAQSEQEYLEYCGQLRLLENAGSSEGI